MKRKILSIPPNYFYFCIALNILLFFVLKSFNIIKFPFNLIGAPFIVFGFYLVFKSDSLFKKANTPEKFIPSKCVVKENIYKYSRNPMYLGGVIILIGLSILMTNVFGLILPILFFLFMNFMFIPFEEEKMKIELGDEYKDYIKKVRRWI